MPANKFVREMATKIEDLCRDNKVKVTFNLDLAHPRAYFEKNGEKKFHVLPGTPSDHRSGDNNMSQVRNLFREKGWFEDRAEGLERLGKVIVDAPPKPKLEHSIIPETLHGIECPQVPEIAKGHVGRGIGRHHAYVAFQVEKVGFAMAVLEKGGKLRDVVRILAQHGHHTKESALEQAIRNAKIKDGSMAPPETALIKLPKGKVELDAKTAMLLIQALMDRVISQHTAPLAERIEELETKLGMTQPSSVPQLHTVQANGHTNGRALAS